MLSGFVCQAVDGGGRRSFVVVMYAPLEGFVWDDRAEATVDVACFASRSWLGDMLGDILGESLGNVDARGAASPVEGVTFPGVVFHGRKPNPSRTSDGGVLDVTPFLMASLLKFVSATMSTSVDAFASLSGLQVKVEFCNMKSKLLR